MKCLIIMLTMSNLLAFTIEKSLVNEACKKYEFGDCNLIHAIVWTETHYRSLKVMDSNGEYSYGPMQVQCETAREVGLKFNCDQLHNNPLIGLRFGIEYIRKQMEKYDTFDDVVAAYNAGGSYRCNNNRFDDKGKVICYAGEYVNYNYVQKVVRKYNYLERLRNENSTHE